MRWRDAIRVLRPVLRSSNASDSECSSSSFTKPA
jgi:hypothetical protein